MPRREPGPSVKDPEMYEALRDNGASKEKAARISNAAARDGRSRVGRRGGEAEAYEDWTVDALRERARELGLVGYSHLRKAELIDALRNHYETSTSSVAVTYPGTFALKRLPARHPGYSSFMIWRLKQVAEWFQYRIKWLLLNLYGPADQDPSVDPLQRLKREHGEEGDP